MIYIFDLDGTLIDSKQRHQHVLDDVLCRQNINASSNIRINYLNFKAAGHSTYDYLLHVLQLDDEIAKNINKMWVQSIENEEYLADDSLYHDTLPTLQSLSDSQHQIIFLTARKNKRGLLQELENLQIDKYAQAIYVVSPLNAEAEKLNIISNLGNNLSVIIVGDTEIEYKIANKLGVRYIILNRGFRSKGYWDELHVPSYSSLIEGISCLTDSPKSI